MSAATRPPKPEPFGPAVGAVPEALRDREQWVAWRYDWREDGEEWTKVPIDATSSGFASSTDAETWASFAETVAYHEREDTNTDGIGFVFADGDLTMGVDLDDCRDPETGDLEAWAADAVDALPTYWEASPSGTGLHALAFGIKPDGKTRADVEGTEGHIEMYDSGRFFTVTGHTIEDAPDEVRQVNDAIADVHAEYIADDDSGDASPAKASDGGVQAVSPGANPGVDAGKSPSNDGPADLDDEELLERATSAENGDKFRRLWIDDTSGYPSHSEADLALAGLLAFWTGGDRDRIDRLFRQSELYREKWDREDYRERTIDKALDGLSEFYDPDRRGDRRQDRRDDDDRDGGDTDATGISDGPVAKFIDACARYKIDAGRVGTVTRDGEKVSVGVSDIVPEASITDAVFAFKRNADRLSGEEKQAVIGYAILLDLQDHGEFFKTQAGHLYYFYNPETQVYRVDDSGNAILAQDFRALVWERYDLFAGRFSRNLGQDIETQARRDAPERAVYRFAHYDADAGELYVNDFGDGYYAVTDDGVEWRSNGTDVFFLPTERAEPYEYLAPDERPDLPSELPGERPLWCGDGDPIMRVFGNRVNYSESAALGPADQRNQLYLHLHTLPFIDALNARPIMAWVGEKGSGKTVLQRSIGRFIYGEDFTESVMPDGKDDFLAKVTNQALAFLDNYDDGVEWANDILAAVATGAGIDQRELYTTNSLRQETPRCWLSLTSRDPPFRRDDVADRTLVFRVERVDDGFVGMGDYLRQVTAYRDLLWSVYLDNLRAVIQAYHERDTAAMSSAHRMADWAIFARIVGDALDVGDVEALLEVMETERATFALENEPWARVLDQWIDDNPQTAGEWHRAGDLADELEAHAAEHDLPIDVTHAAGVGAKLSTYHSELAELYGLEIEDGHRNQYRFVTDDGGHNATGLGKYQ